MRRAGLAAAWAALLAVSCGAGSGSPPPTPVPTPTGPHVVLPSGAIYSVELALTPEQKAQGLMFRESLREKSGMLFLFPDNPPMPHHFWMKNTMIPLDMIWLDRAGKVLFISADTPPCRADPCPMYGPDMPVATVLEIAGGLAQKEGIKIGSEIQIRIPGSAPS